MSNLSKKEMYSLLAYAGQQAGPLCRNGKFLLTELYYPGKNSGEVTLQLLELAQRSFGTAYIVGVKVSNMQNIAVGKYSSVGGTRKYVRNLFEKNISQKGHQELRLYFTFVKG